MNIQLNIERLVLDGIDLPQHQGPLLKASVEAELTRLLSKGGISSSLAAGVVLPRIYVEPMKLNASNNPTQLGRQIAKSVYGGLAHEQN